MCLMSPIITRRRSISIYAARIGAGLGLLGALAAAMSQFVMIRNGGAMSDEILTLGDALNYFGAIGGLVASMVAAVAGGV